MGEIDGRLVPWSPRRAGTSARKITAQIYAMRESEHKAQYRPRGLKDLRVRGRDVESMRPWCSGAGYFIPLILALLSGGYERV